MYTNVEPLSRFNRTSPQNCDICNDEIDKHEFFGDFDRFGRFWQTAAVLK